MKRAYRAWLKAAGKVVRVVDATAAPAAIPDFDPEKDGIYEREMINGLQDKLRNALLRLALRERDVAELRKRNAPKR